MEKTVHPVDAIAEELSSDGWYKQDARDTFISCYDKLISNGFIEQDAIDLLADVFHATANEFGQ